MNHLPNGLSLLQESERQLAEALTAVAERHTQEYEVHHSCRLFSQWASSHQQQLEPFLERYGRASESEPKRLRKALFHGRRKGGYGLLRDLQDLMLLAGETCHVWTAIERAAMELHDIQLQDLARACATRVEREMAWLTTHIKTVAPQALIVPAK